MDQLRRRSLGCFFLAVLALPLGGCRLFGGSDEPEPIAKKAPVVAPVYLATVTDGRIVSRHEQKAAWVAEVQDQLAFAAGHLSGIGGIADLNRLEVSLGSAMPAGDGALQVSYVATFLVGWSSATPPPATVNLALPRAGDRPGRAAFFAAYHDRCIDAPGGDVGVATYWNHYRPGVKGCPLAAGDPDKGVAVQVTVALSPHGGAATALASQADLGIRSAGSRQEKAPKKEE